jgi:hypothetical protein
MALFEEVFCDLAAADMVFVEDVEWADSQTFSK